MSDEPEFSGPTPERLAKAGGLVEEFRTGSGRVTPRLLDASVLDLLLKSGAIDSGQYSAGLRFYTDWYSAGLAASGAVDPAREPVDCAAGDPLAVWRLEALQRWQEAVLAAGKIHSHPLIHLVLLDENLAAYGRRTKRWNNAKLATVAAKSSLIDALAALDVYYHGRQGGRGGIVHSHADDYRPEIGGS